jgi:hypothetical protein
MLSGVGKKDSAKGFKPETKEVVIWTVNMSPSIFEELNKGFNNYVDRRDMKLVVRNFCSLRRLPRIFPRAVQAGTSPDVVLVPNHGGHIYLDPYIVSLGENIIDFDDFENRFHALFVDELLFEEKQKVDWTESNRSRYSWCACWFWTSWYLLQSWSHADDSEVLG